MYFPLSYQHVYILLKAIGTVLLCIVSTTAYPYEGPLPSVDDKNAGVYITGLKVFTGPVDRGANDGVIKKNIINGQGVSLPPDYVSFVIEFNSCEPAHSTPGYAYRLQGLEEDWNQVGVQQFASYTSLPPGTYVFEVKIEGQSMYSGVSDTVEITIPPTFWKSPKAYILYIILIPGMIYGFANLYTIKPRKDLAVQTEVTDRAEEEILSAGHTPEGAKLTGTQGPREKKQPRGRISLTKSAPEACILPEKLSRNNADEQFLSETLDFIYRNMSDGDISVERLAAHFHMNRSNLYRKIKAITGQTATEYIRTVRMKRALKYMETGDNNISEVAFKVGFDSPGYFTRCFKRQFGLTPSQYRPAREKKGL
ncbi:helix-turn-helix domain-containing protein [Roseivirga sp. BDSF3-8]|uniref:helix-turn-helix domain-containing protein n=1 Tax=Roseivirga sp. BDSF3-8 TaxID=3241598 RepID=UPI00353192C6